MASEIVGSGPRSWIGLRDNEGHREYKVKFIVKSESILDGPQIALSTPGLFLPGSVYALGNDYDPWAFCQPKITVAPHNEVEGDSNYYWSVDQVFSTRPLGRCNDTNIDDPLLEPQKISGGFTRFTKEAQYDRHGDRIVNSAHEPIRGQIVEFDENRHFVQISQNVPVLGIELWDGMIDHVNEFTLWGFSPRCIKLSNVTWQELYYGSCYRYYTRTFYFEINDETFDRTALDEGTKVLNGHWGRGGSEGYNWVLDNIGGSAPDPDNPSHFKRLTDREGNPMRALLKDGKPAKIAIDLPGTGSDEAAEEPGEIDIEYYKEADFLLLGIPTTIGGQ